jgi:hypothetical protein
MERAFYFLELACLSRPGQVITVMNAETEEVDSAAVFAMATSLKKACEDKEKCDPSLNLGAAYNGWDQFTRELMRVALIFEEWACTYVAFPHIDDVWSYYLELIFGISCLKVINADCLASFGRDDCLRLAYVMEIPVWGDTELPVPVDIVIENTDSGSLLKALRIQTVRRILPTEKLVPYSEGDDLFDSRFGDRLFGIYSIDTNGITVQIDYRNSYQDVRTFVSRLVPGASLPERVIGRIKQADGQPYCGGEGTPRTDCRR